MTGIGTKPPAPPPELSPRSPRRVRLRNPATGTILALALVVVVLGTVTGVAAGSLGPTEYGARVDLLFQPPDSVVEVERQLMSQQAVLESDVVLRPVARDVDMPLASLRTSVETEVLTDSQILRVTVGAPEQEEAVGLAQRIAERYREALIEDPPAQVGRAWIITPAHPTADPLEPQPAQGGAAGALVGLMVAAGLSFFLYELRSRSRRAAGAPS